MRRGLAAVLALLPALAAAAEDRAGVRVGDHPGRGRIVFDWPAPPAYSVDQQGDRLVLRFPEHPAPDVTGVRRLPRNVLGIAPDPEGTRVTLRPGATIRHFRLGARVVVDVLDPPGPAPAGRGQTATPAVPPKATAKASPAPRPTLHPVEAEATIAAIARSVAAAAAPPAAPVPSAAAIPPAAPVPPLASAPVPAPARPLAEAPTAPPVPAARQARLIAGQGGAAAAVRIAVPPGTGAAVLRRGPQVLIVLDRAERIELGALRNDPVFGAMQAELLPGATLLRLPLAPTARLSARRDATGWIFDPGLPAAAPGTPRDAGAILAEAEDASTPRLILRAASPGQVIPVTDPETGMPLLIGTVREAGSAVAVARRLPELDLLETSLGAAVLARADSVGLQPGLDRFVISGVRLATDAAALQAPAPAMTRSFDIPAQPVAQLLERLRSLQVGIAASPPLARLPQRRAAGETLLALGLPQEAQALLGLSFTEDPRAAADPSFAALAAAAAMLAGRLGEAGALQSPDLPPSDEARLWQAALTAALGEPRAAGPGFAATLPLLLAYPEGLRARLVPDAALALAEAAEGAALGRLIEAGGSAAAVALPRAIIAEAEGRIDDALTGYDQVARGRDRQARAQAMRRATELRLASGRIDAAQAARALEATLFAWRGDAAEVAARLRLATLRQDAGDAQGALALLRESEATLPGYAATLRPAIQTAFLAALEQAPPVTAVGLFDAHPDMLKGDARADAAVQVLVDRLVALDLGDRAGRLLQQAIGRATGEARAGLGLRLATLRLADGDAAAALSVLAETAGPALPDAMLINRTILAARAEARRGALAAATTALQALGPAGTEPLSEILAEAEDWPGAATALGAHLALALPAPPAALDDAHCRLLLRQAAFLAMAGNDVALASLRDAQSRRMKDGPFSEPFALLTADPLRGLADLPRLQQELKLFRSLPKRLDALRTAAAEPR